jgi:hypothetical protein
MTKIDFQFNYLNTNQHNKILLKRKYLGEIKLDVAEGKMYPNPVSPKPKKCICFAGQTETEKYTCRVTHRSCTNG